MAGAAAHGLTRGQHVRATLFQRAAVAAKVADARSTLKKAQGGVEMEEDWIMRTGGLFWCQSCQMTMTWVLTSAREGHLLRPQCLFEEAASVFNLALTNEIH